MTENKNINYIDEIWQKDAEITEDERLRYHAFHTFEKVTGFWEGLFGHYGDRRIPDDIQRVFVNDFICKAAADILLPYHYDEEKLAGANKRLTALLDRVDDEVILDHPAADKYIKCWLINLKADKDISIDYGDDGITVRDRDITVIKEKSPSIRVNRFIIKNGQIEFWGILQSPVFTFSEAPELYINIKGNEDLREEVPLQLSSYSYHKAKQLNTAKFFFNIRIDADNVNSFSFTAVCGGREYKCKFTFNAVVPFSKDRKRIIRDGRAYKYKGSTFSISRVTAADENEYMKKQLKKGRRKDTMDFLLRNFAYRKKKGQHIWLYYDCQGVSRDNAYYQLEHDLKQNDGIRRYYIVNEDDFHGAISRYPREIRKICVKFGSSKHKQLYLAAEKIITAYIEQNNYRAFDNQVYKKYLDIFDFPEVYYLQHGVLHAHTPWKYSMDRLFLRKEIVSTRYEEKNLIDNYCFSEEYIAKTGMPRYDFIEKKEIEQSSKRILFAPSWRSYLIEKGENGWIPEVEKFLSSQFYQDIQALMNNNKLTDLLEANDMYLDIKMHPIFRCYRDFFKCGSDRIRMTEDAVDENAYSLFITDFSSYLYDFVYLSIPVIYYIPDYDMFRSGINVYRELDIPPEDGLGEFAKTQEELTGIIERLAQNGFEISGKFRERTDDLFYYHDNNQRDRIYQEIK